MHAKITITTPITQKIYDVFAKLIYTENIPVPIGTVAVIKAVKNANTLSLFSSGNICNKKASIFLPGTGTNVVSRLGSADNFWT